jgi:hypothetical protein
MLYQRINITSRLGRVFINNIKCINNIKGGSRNASIKKHKGEVIMGSYLNKSSLEKTLDYMFKGIKLDECQYVLLEKLFKSYMSCISEGFNYDSIFCVLQKRNGIDFMSVTMISMFLSSVLLHDSKCNILTSSDRLAVGTLMKQLDESNLVI